MIPFDIIVAVDENYGIGKDGALPWHLSGDMKHFKEITLQTQDPQKKNAVVMGRKTWDSLPVAFQPLPDRVNCVLSRNKDLSLPEEVFVAESLDAAASLLEDEDVERIFVIGGAQIFSLALRMLACKKIYLTEIDKDFDCDTFFPKDLFGFQKVSESESIQEGKVSYRFCEHDRVDAVE